MHLVARVQEALLALLDLEGSGRVKAENSRVRRTDHQQAHTVLLRGHPTLYARDLGVDEAQLAPASHVAPKGSAHRVHDQVAHS